jgi:hypothetical protein
MCAKAARRKSLTAGWETPAGRLVEQVQAPQSAAAGGETATRKPVEQAQAPPPEERPKTLGKRVAENAECGHSPPAIAALALQPRQKQDSSPTPMWPACGHIDELLQGARRPAPREPPPLTAMTGSRLRVSSIHAKQSLHRLPDRRTDPFLIWLAKVQGSRDPLNFSVRVIEHWAILWPDVVSAVGD